MTLEPLHKKYKCRAVNYTIHRLALLHVQRSIWQVLIHGDNRIPSVFTPLKPHSLGIGKMRTLMNNRVLERPKVPVRIHQILLIATTTP
ncbi:hypothetical protein PAXRUDRAFT_465402 [Paxillus rubicundulus Ve08.2h10]|uniref:Uncharacterized protein n=1 Tax=Paxillus rubicundulus Ve08.2h10 TaxID=930991 RepID=A0A0D0DWF9_9AGAM|nr:hypothetical protein PAXRUDRAFT_465402 [Paxillus rubicundulus Ve08.2h10]